uniref:Splicing factor YJU2 n=1 Tax=Trichuris muris TaxID=70415 RepID=A0A5S6QIG9_TRIMR
MTGTERKVLNKYYPPDFDPRKLPKVSVPRNRQYVIRVMAPFNMRCNTCGEYIYKGKKFNARRETVEDENYLGLPIFRFYFRCPQCLAEITFKTDLKNCDYAQEHGSTRLFEAEKLIREKEASEQAAEEDERTNPMKMLEKRTKMSRFEMEALDRLEELREMNKRQANVNYDRMLDQARKPELEELRQQYEEETALLRAMGFLSGELPSDAVANLPVIKRLPDPDSDDESKHQALLASDFKTQKKVKLSRQKEVLQGAVAVRKKSIRTADTKAESVAGKEFSSAAAEQCATTRSAGLGLLGSYGGSSSEEST